jgi:hypothetical protein
MGQSHSELIRKFLMVGLVNVVEETAASHFNLKIFIKMIVKTSLLGSSKHVIHDVTNQYNQISFVYRK